VVHNRRGENWGALKKELFSSLIVVSICIYRLLTPIIPGTIFVVGNGIFCIARIKEGGIFVIMDGPRAFFPTHFVITANYISAL
jgi:hypothetical protein